MTSMTTPVPAAASAAADDDLLAAFLRGAGLAGVPVNWQVTPEFMELLGTMLATAVGGAVELLAARTELKREVDADKTMVVVRNNNPLKFLPDGSAALTQMLRKKMPGFMGPADAMRDAFADLATHQACVKAGTQAAVEEVLAQLAPGAVPPPDSVLARAVPALRKAGQWDNYCTRHAALAAEVGRGAHGALGAAIARGYEAEHARLQDRDHA